LLKGENEMAALRVELDVQWKGAEQASEAVAEISTHFRMKSSCSSRRLKAWNECDNKRTELENDELEREKDQVPFMSEVD